MKVYTIQITQHRVGRDDTIRVQKGTLQELIETFKYTLECGQSFQHEKGNKKINVNPKTIKSLVTNLNNAINNSALNGYAGKYYELIEN